VLSGGVGARSRWGGGAASVWARGEMKNAPCSQPFCPSIDRLILTLPPPHRPTPTPTPTPDLGGVLDMTGELNRHAIARATRRDAAAVARCRDLVEGLMGQFLQVVMGGGEGGKGSSCALHMLGEGADRGVGFVDQVLPKRPSALVTDPHYCCTSLSPPQPSST